MEPSYIDKRPLYNSRIIKTYISFIKAKYSYININELISHAQMTSYQIEDEGHWFSQEQIDLFYEKLEQLSGNKNIAREAGRYAASPEALGVMRQYALGFIGPAQAYEMVGKYASVFVKSSIYESKKIAPNRVEITVSLTEGAEEKPFQCENRIGYFEAIATIFNYKLPKIEHPECLFRGGKVCHYIITWRHLHSDFWKKIRNYAAALLLLIFAGSFLKYPDFSLHIILPTSIVLFSLLTVYANNIRQKELQSAVDNLRGSSDKLIEQMNLNYNNALLSNEIGQAISKQISIDSILLNVIQVLQRRLDYDRGAIFLSNKDKTRLFFRRGFGYTDEQFTVLKNISFHLDKPDSKGIFVVSYRDKRPFLINDVDEITEDLSHRSLEFSKRMGSKSFICCPIVYENEPLGILAVDNIKTKRPLVQSDINILMGIAPEIGISIHNAMALEAIDRQFKSLLQVLAASIDARDPLTAGHSEKVTEYTLGICNELGMPKNFCEMMRVASLLHDYGKIGVRDSILKKEGKLSVEEHEEIKAHVEKTRKILEQIHFEGIYKDVPEIAGSHHEKLDGSGYPRGLRGKEIPLGARILAVADFFEAITSKRHYRDPMPIDIAFGLLDKGIGSDFDNEVVAAFVRYYQKTTNWVPEQEILKIM
jgi:HD-GYP domain-containing protein (c-di-GMP phosphodiesterase class II)